jgi:hypothetical protein
MCDIIVLPPPSRYECSQTIECGLPLSRVLDALQLLGQADRSVRFDFIPFNVIPFTSVGTDASSKAKVILGSLNPPALPSHPACPHEHVQSAPASISPLLSGTVGCIIYIQLHYLIPVLLRLVDNDAVSSCGECSI